MCVHACVSVYVCVRVCTCVCACVCTCVCFCICVWVFLYVFVYVCTNLCHFVCMHALIHIPYLGVFRGDFTVQWYHHHNSTCSVFLLLHHMAIVLLDKSIIFQEKIQGKSSRVPVNTIYHRILWGKYACMLGMHRVQILSGVDARGGAQTG